jgi:hypothetical protein
MKSNILQPTAGVPQGSVLGPLLFLIYINDIQDITNTNLRQFADNASAFQRYRIFDEIREMLIPDLISVLQWSTKWLMDFNPNKTEGLNICLLIDQEKPPIIVENKEITDVDTHKHLGLILNNRGTWSEHIKYMCGKSLKKMGVLRSLKYTFD